MRRSKGFILAEILTGMLLQAGFILVLCGTFYLLVSFGSGTQQILTARERGQRVIAYVDSRIKNAGLGMWRLTSSKQYRDIFTQFTNSDKPLYTKKGGGLRLPVAISNMQVDDPTNEQFATQANSNNTSGNIHRGDTLTLLYAQRNLDTGEKAKNFVIVNKSVNDTETTPYNPKYEFISGKNEYKSSKFYGGTYNRKRYIGSYAVMTGAGEPLYIDKIPNETDDDDTNIGLVPQISTPTSAEPIIISGDELLYLKCERMFVCPDTKEKPERNFKFQELTNDWGKREPHQLGILELYMEIDRNTNIFTLWVLASGGTDGRVHECPKSWPTSANSDNKSIARWKDEYKYHVVYVSKASWKLHNVNFSSADDWN